MRRTVNDTPHNRRRSIFGDVLQKAKDGKAGIVTKTHFEYPLHSVNKRVHQCNIPGILRPERQNSSMLYNLQNCTDQRIKGGKRVQFKPQILMHIYFSESMIELLDENIDTKMEKKDYPENKNCGNTKRISNREGDSFSNKVMKVLQNFFTKKITNSI